MAAFVRPRLLAERFRTDAPWVDALVVAILLSVASAAFIPAQVFLDRVQNPTDALGRPVQVTSGPEAVVLHGRILAAVSALAGQPMIAFALAGVLALVFSVLAGGRADFRQYLALASHALVVFSLGVLLEGPLRLLTGNPDAHWSLALVVPGLHGDSVLARTVASLDLFTIWMLLVLAVGVAVLDGFRPWLLRTALPLLGLYTALAATLSFLERAGA